MIEDILHVQTIGLNAFEYSSIARTIIIVKKKTTTSIQASLQLRYLKISRALIEEQFSPLARLKCAIILQYVLQLN